MGGTKIVVFQLKEIIKNMIFIGIGLVVIVSLIFFFIPKEKPKEQDSASLYTPGTYYSEIILHNSPVTVAVTVSPEEIISIDLEEMGETQAVFYPLFQPTMESLSKEILSTQNLDVARKDNAYTEEILIKAIRTALEKAEVGV